MDNLKVYQDKYYKLSDLLKFNKRFFSGNNWRETQNKIRFYDWYDPNKYLDNSEWPYKYYSHDPKSSKIYLTVEWCKKNIPDPDKDFYCYW